MDNRLRRLCSLLIVKPVGDALLSDGKKGRDKMPAILTHDQFGREALGAVSSVLGFATFDEHDAFMLGNQGPDPLFYVVADPRVAKENSDVGDLMHHDHPTRLLAALHDAISMLPESDRRIGEAYAAGFLCHYLLDSAVHPLVFHYQYGLCDAGVSGLDRSDGSRVHAEIERDLDEAVLFVRTGKTIAEFIPWRKCLLARDETLSALDKLYFYLCLWTYGRTIPLDLYSRAVKSFRRVQHLFWAPRCAKRELLGTLEMMFSDQRYSLYRAMAHHVRAEQTSDFDNREHVVWKDPFTGVARMESFWDLFEGAHARVLDATESLFDPHFGSSAAHALTGGRNFSGELVEDILPPDEGGEG